MRHRTTQVATLCALLAAVGCDGIEFGGDCESHADCQPGQCCVGGDCVFSGETECPRGDADADTDGDTDIDVDVDTDGNSGVIPDAGPDVIVGRLWPMPNPIRFNGPPNYEGWIVADVAIENIGTEKVTIDDLTLEGSDEFYRKAEHSFPKDKDGPGSGFGLGIYFQPVAGGSATGSMVVHTSDPTSPTVEVPFVVDPGAEPIDEASNPPEMCSHIWTEPNPIRFVEHADQGPQLVTLTIRKVGDHEESVVTSLEVIGDGLSIDEIRGADGPGTGQVVSLPYEYPLAVDVVFEADRPAEENGLLIIEWGNQAEVSYKLGVPIIVPGG